MFKLLKWLIILVIIGLVVAAITGYKIGGKTVQDHARDYLGAETYDEGVKDIRSLVGEAVKAVGDAISPEATDEERKELEKVIKNELKEEPGTQKQPSETTQ